MTTPGEPRSSTLDNFERIGIFRFTRAIALVAVVIVAVGLIVAGVTFVGTLLPQSTEIGGLEVAAALKGKSAGPAASEAADDHGDATMLSTISLPAGVNKEFTSAENRKVLAGWLKSLPKDARQEFVDNMEDIITYANAHQMNATDAINAYRELKFDNVGTTGFDRVERGIARATVIAGFLCGLLLLALFSLVLVLLAIERNTRVGVRMVS